jgi:hypothetical protein
MSRKVFTAGEVLAAADVNSFLMDQTVMSFAGTAARGSAIGTAVEGMVSYLEDANGIAIYDGAAWKQVLNTTGSILQVVSTTKTDSFSATLGGVNGRASVTGLTASITPISTSSKILVLVMMNVSTAADQFGVVLTRGVTDLAVGDAAGNRARRTNFAYPGFDGYSGEVVNITFLDSPASTSSLTYGVDVGNALADATKVAAVNRTVTDGNFTSVPRTASTITLMEVAG